MAAYALTEAGSGSDAAGSMRTRAVRDGDAYVLDGTKIWITQGSIADVVTVFAVTDPEKGPNGISAFVVEKGTPGFSVGKLEKKMGIRGSPTVELHFESCRVPAANLIGVEGEGFKIGDARPRPVAARDRGAGARDRARRARLRDRVSQGTDRVRQAARRSSKACNSCSPTCTPKWKPPACCSTKRRASATKARPISRRGPRCASSSAATSR